MIAFVDLPKGIRILRVEGGGDVIKRTVLGRVSKSSLTIEAPLSDELTAEETVEVQKIIDAYNEAESSRRRTAALNLPVMLREVLEYFESDGTDVEKTMVVSAIMEAVRRIRKGARASSES